MSITLRWKNEELVSELTDAEAVEVCNRIGSDHPSRQYTQTLIADLRRWGNLFESKRYWLHEHAHRQIEREAESGAGKSAAAPMGLLPRIAAFLTPASRRLASGADVSFSSGPLELRIHRTGPQSHRPGWFAVRGVSGFAYAGVYLAWISPAGEFYTTKYCNESVLALLDEFESDPREYAAACGRRTGRCCFCRLKLDDPISIGMGYGPTCAKNYDLPHGKRALAAVLAGAASEAVKPEGPAVTA